jgi:mRNA-degrading endonuclease YafQ of YafQ-DinJ toxin-antitoxin module
MQRELVLTKPFEKSFKKFAGSNQPLKTSIQHALAKLKHDAFDPSLKTHKLGGKMAALLACSCGYDCRIIFDIRKDKDNPTIENIVLLDVGTHDDVY